MGGGKKRRRKRQSCPVRQGKERTGGTQHQDVRKSADGRGEKVNEKNHFAKVVHLRKIPDGDQPGKKERGKTINF